MKNKQLIILIASSFMLAGCGSKEDTSSSTEKDENQIAYEMISKAYDYLEGYEGDFKRTNTFGVAGKGQSLDTYEEKIIYDHDSKECLYQMDKNNDYLYQYFNKKDVSSNSYGMYVNTSIDNQKLEYKSTDEGIAYLMNIYNDPLRYTAYRDVLFYINEFTSLAQLHDVVDVSNSNKHAFLKQTAYEDSLEYFKEHFTLLFSELTGSPYKFNDFSSIFSYEKVNDLSVVKFSGESSTLFEATEKTDEEFFEVGIEYIFTLDGESRFTNIERNISFDYRSYEAGEEETYFDINNIETFDYEIGDWALSEDTEGYTAIDEYPTSSLDIVIFNCFDGTTYSSSSSLTNLRGDATIDFDYLNDVEHMIPNQYNQKYRKEGTKIEQVYLDPECTKEFTGTDMKMGELTLYCTYDYLDNVCIATERGITDISAYGYKFGDEILFDDRVRYSYEYNFIDFSGAKEMRLSEDDFEVYSDPIGANAFLNLTINDVTYDKEALLEGITYDLNNGTVITKNYGLVNQ